MRDFFDEQKAAQGFSPEAYLKYVEGGNPRRMPLIGKIAIYVEEKRACNSYVTIGVAS